jgi:mannose-6-phosphate isomerase-like protein (cupin superfamily)
MRAGVYAPVGEDGQTPHTQDELYIVISGTGEVVNDGERRVFGPQDLIFVKAGAEHRFENFSDDFATWVIFWGAKGGES